MAPKFAFSALGLCLAFLLASRPAPAEATRPLIRTALAIKNLEMSMPLTLDEVSKKEFLGLDREDEATRKRVLKDAAEYIEARTGKKAAFHRWVETCTAKAGTTEENPFCRVEQDRKKQATLLRTPGAPADERNALTSALRDGRFEAATGASSGLISAVIRSLDHSGDLNQVAKTYSEGKNCHSSTFNYLLAYKLEEQFPDPEIVETARKIYRKGSQCGNDMYAAQSSFRYGLLELWKNECGEIADLMTKVESTPEASSFHARAKYWRYHCASAKKDEEAKKAAREALLKDHPLSFQTLAITGDDPSAISQIMSDSPIHAAIRSLVRTDLNPLVRGIEALIRLKQEGMAAELVDRAIGDVGSLEPEVRLYTAVLMNRVGFALPKFKILSGLFQDVPKMVTADTMKLFFPLWYVDVVKKQERQIDPLLIISLIRQESAFNKAARSGVGARGLMQVMPATARMVAAVRTIKLFDPETNVKIGTKYFVQRLHQYDGDVELTLAAYNAGFSRVDQWKKRYPTDNRMLFLDFIPFRETRDYVSSILRNYYWYVKLYNQELASTPVDGEGPKINISEMKVQAIMSANAGAAATLADQK